MEEEEAGKAHFSTSGAAVWGKPSKRDGILPALSSTIADVLGRCLSSPRLCFQNPAAINDVSCHFETGSLVAVIGASGAGKSTLLDIMARRFNKGRLTVRPAPGTEGGHRLNRLPRWGRVDSLSSWAGGEGWVRVAVKG